MYNPKKFLEEENNRLKARVNELTAAVGRLQAEAAATKQARIDDCLKCKYFYGMQDRNKLAVAVQEANYHLRNLEKVLNCRLKLDVLMVTLKNQSANLQKFIDYIEKTFLGVWSK